MAPFTVGWDPVLRAFVLPRRWCVERTFSWINRCRRSTVRDYERLPQHHPAMIQWAMIALMTRRLAHHHT